MHIWKIIVIEGEMILKFRDNEVKLSEGEMYVVPKGVEHKPCAEKECKILVIEPRGVINTGDAGGTLTINEEMWIWFFKGVLWLLIYFCLYL